MTRIPVSGSARQANVAGTGAIDVQHFDGRLAGEVEVFEAHVAQLAVLGSRDVEPQSVQVEHNAPQRPNRRWEHIADVINYAGLS
jgi:hypothetical protein